MKYRVTYSPEAQQHLTNIFRWIADHGSPEAAERFVMSIYDYCDGLSSFPQRGTARDDLFPGLRTLGFRRRATIAFIIAAQEVEIHGIYYGGRDYEARILEDLD